MIKIKMVQILMEGTGKIIVMMIWKKVKMEINHFMMTNKIILEIHKEKIKKHQLVFHHIFQK
jgi:hypothetical protein